MGPRWRYLINEVNVGLRRNLLMTIATIVTVTVSLALLGMGLLVQRQVSLAQQVLYAEIEVSIFLMHDIGTEQRASLERELSANPVVAGVIYVSKEQAFKEYQRISSGDESFAAAPEDVREVLPPSYRVKLTDPREFEVVASQFAEYPGVDEIVDQRDQLKAFFQVMNALRNAALAIAFLQLAAAAALISNTIRVTAFARREQTGIMKLVGATNWYIRLPFVVEGIIAGVCGAVVAGGLLLIAQLTLLPSLKGAVQFIPFVNIADVLATIPILVLIGAVIASIASVVSLRRFLAV